jgi:hypothetical protein
MSREQNAGQSHNIKTENSSFERVEEFRHFEINLTNQNSTQEEIKIRLISGNACYHSVQNILSSGLISKHTHIKIYRTVIWPVVLYGCGTRSLTLREERRLWVFEIRVLRGIFGPERDEVTGEWRKLHKAELYDLYCSHNIFMRWEGHVARRGRGEANTGFW